MEHVYTTPVAAQILAVHLFSTDNTTKLLLRSSSLLDKVVELKKSRSNSFEVTQLAETAFNNLSVSCLMFRVLVRTGRLGGGGSPLSNGIQDSLTCQTFTSS